MAEKVYFLSTDEIIQINAEQIFHFGGVHGVRDQALLESAAQRPMAKFGGVHLYKSFYEKAAVYAHGIIKNHPFIDGNKRTGIICALIFLDRNGYALPVDDDELVQITLAIATSELSLDQIVHYFRDRVMVNK